MTNSNQFSIKGKKRGILSVLMQAFYDIEYCFTVNENVFTPPPKVKSAVIRLIRNLRIELGLKQSQYAEVYLISSNSKTLNLLTNLIEDIKVLTKASDIKILIPEVIEDQISVQEKGFLKESLFGHTVS